MKICSFLMIAALFTMMFSTQMLHANNLEMCVKHCVPNQCMKEAKNATPKMCEDACKKLCNKLEVDQEKYIVPKGQSRFCQMFPSLCP
ncbi:uncharacterized protein LOC18992750 [Eutrema salsugineum]|nr:uncharacterized protein LOC18992750 [Eutrema salsugineum]